MDKDNVILSSTPELNINQSEEVTVPQKKCPLKVIGVLCGIAALMIAGIATVALTESSLPTYAQISLLGGVIAGGVAMIIICMHGILNNKPQSSIIENTQTGK